MLETEFGKRYRDENIQRVSGRRSISCCFYEAKRDVLLFGIRDNTDRFNEVLRVQF